MKISKRVLIISAIAGLLAAAGTLYSATRPVPGEEISTGNDPVVVRQASTFARVTDGAGVVEGRDLVIRPTSGGYSSAALTDEDGAANGFDQITAQAIRSYGVSP